jgi:DNA-binding NarL/FixJ family response regulator
MGSVFERSADLTVLPPAIVQQFKFTDDESRICLALVQGKTLDDIADEQSRSRNYLRHQFFNLLQKTGTNTEAKLVTVLLSRPELFS